MLKTKNEMFKSEGGYAQIILIVTVIFVAAIGYLLYQKHSRDEQVNSLPHSIMPYVDGDSAVSQVNNFYSQYIRPKNISNYQKNIIEGYGDNNLSFYSQYYQHGFDPITCSDVMPTNVSAHLESTGAVAKVRALAQYPDNSRGAIDVIVVLQDKGLVIDSITCPGDKGNLQPSQT